MEKIRYQSIYTITTKEKVILDFEITDRLLTIATLILFLSESQTDFLKTNKRSLLKDKAIIGAVKSVFLKWLIPFVDFHN